MARTKQTDFERTLAAYKQKYNVDSLDSPNDVANLHSMIRNQLLITQLQDQLDTIVGDAGDTSSIKKILDSIVALSETNMQLEKTLGIDRKTRKQEASESIPEYLATLRQRAREWLETEERLLKVYCPDCKIMVGRISGVYATTEYFGSFQCPQCNKRITVNRVERDVFYDVKDSEWRRKYPIEIEQARRTNAPAIIDTEADLIIGNED